MIEKNNLRIMGEAILTDTPVNITLNPSPALLCKLGSVVIHAAEIMLPGGHIFDVDTMKTLMADPEVAEWVRAMNKLAMLPVPRNPKVLELFK